MEIDSNFCFRQVLRQVPTDRSSVRKNPWILGLNLFSKIYILSLLNISPIPISLTHFLLDLLLLPLFSPFFLSLFFIFYSFIFLFFFSFILLLPFFPFLFPCLSLQNSKIIPFPFFFPPPSPSVNKKKKRVDLFSSFFP